MHKKAVTKIFLMSMLILWIIQPLISIPVAAEVKINPTKDTYVYEYDPTLNYGGDNYVYLETQSGRNRLGYMQFDIPSSPVIDQAYLYVYIRTVTSTTTISVHHVPNNGWDEYTLTWNNRPSYTTTALTSILVVSGYRWLVFNITSFVVQKPGQTVSFVMNTSSEEATSFYSKEYSNTDRHPYLCLNPDTGGLNIDHPADKYIFNNTVGNTITWTPSALSPSKYNVTKDGALFEDDVWDGSTITVNVDETSLGSHLYTLSVNNTEGDSFSDSITVIIFTL